MHKKIFRKNHFLAKIFRRHPFWLMSQEIIDGGHVIEVWFFSCFGGQSWPLERDCAELSQNWAISSPVMVCCVSLLHIQFSIGNSVIFLIAIKIFKFFETYGKFFELLDFSYKILNFWKRWNFIVSLKIWIENFKFSRKFWIFLGSFEFFRIFFSKIIPDFEYCESSLMSYFR